MLIQPTPCAALSDQLALHSQLAVFAQPLAASVVRQDRRERGNPVFQKATVSIAWALLDLPNKKTTCRSLLASEFIGYFSCITIRLPASSYIVIYGRVVTFPPS